MHSGIYLDVYRIIRYTLPVGLFRKFGQQPETVYLRFQVISYQPFETARLRIHHDDFRRNAGFAEFHAFIGYRHTEIVAMVVGESLGNFEVAAAVCIGLYHRHGFRFRPDLRAQLFEIVYKRVQIYLHYRFVLFFFQCGDNAFHREMPCTLYENDFISEFFISRQHFAGRRVEACLAFEQPGMSFHAVAYAYEPVHAFVFQKAGKKSVYFTFVFPACIYVGNYDRPFQLLVFGVGCHEIQSHCHGVHVRVVAVVYDCATVDAFQQHEPHFDVFQGVQLRAVTEHVAADYAVHRIFQRCLVAEWQDEFEPFPVVRPGYRARFTVGSLDAEIEIGSFVIEIPGGETYRRIRFPGSFPNAVFFAED